MTAIISLVATLVISLLVTRIGAVALALTGMSREASRFQARSAFTGVGYTTREAEQVVNHPVRRRILGLLMLGGNLGIAVVIASVIATFSEQDDDGTTWWRTLIALSCLAAVYWVGTRSWVDQMIQSAIEWALLKWTRLDVRDYVSLLHLADGYVVLELTVREGDWIAGRNLAQAKLTSEGVLVLGLHRANGKYVGSPNGETVVRVSDTLSLYGPIDRLEELDIRKQGYHGDRAHRIAVATQSEQIKDQNIDES